MMLTVLCVLVLMVMDRFNGVIIDSVDSYADNWAELKRTDGSKAIKLVFLIKQENTYKLKEDLIKISSPGNDEYGNFMSMDEIHDMLAPNPSHLNEIKQWLLNNLDINKNDIKSVTRNSDMISINTNISLTEKLLNCQYYDYYDLNNNDKSMVISRVKIGTNYNVPQHIANYIDLILPTIRFPLQSTIKIRSHDPVSSQYNTVNPIMLQYMYGTYGILGISSSNRIGIASFQNEFYEKQDITKFWTIFNISSTNITNIPITQKSQAEVECSLDLEYITSMGQGIKTEDWWTDGFVPDGLLTFTVNVLNSKNPPNLFSISYGAPQEQFGLSYVNRIDTNFAAIGINGISIFVSSGDLGAGGGCSPNYPFKPNYPGCSPYITSIGGVINNTNNTDESVWVYSGGGFNLYSPMTSWQSDAQKTFLNSSRNLPDSNQYNATNRGYPDLSAQSQYFIIIDNQIEQIVSGTSCSTPTVSGIFGLLNDLRIQNNMKVLGFLNPFIYQIAMNDSNAFNDITTGYNEGCHEPRSNITIKAFEAIKGWDAASGWGSPNFKVLEKYVLETGQNTKKYVHSKSHTSSIE